jgi:exodeoxyribonuclease-1
MIHTPTYLFYDLETSGLNPAFDQILQFAAIRTDTEFRELERHEFRVRLRPDIIPSPGALLATDVSVCQALTTGCSEYTAARQIHALVNQPDTISIGYNTLGFDDTFLRFTFYRNLLPPYFHQWRNGCRRLDIFPIATHYWLQDSPMFDWPMLDGQPTLKLEHLKQANGLAEGQSHDALVDVATTVELARRLRQDEALWVECMIDFDKTAFAARLAQLPLFLERPYALLIHAKFGYGQQCQVPALYLGQSNHAGQRHLWLRLDQPELRQATPNNLHETTWIIRQKPGEPPFVQAPTPHKLNAERRETTRENLAWLRQKPALLADIIHYALAPPPADNFTPDADAALYTNGFATPQLLDQQQRFHQAPLPQKIALASQFSDVVNRELAIRLLCRNEGLAYRFPTYQAYWSQLLTEAPLMDFRGKLRLTPTAALAEIEKVRLTGLTPRQTTILDDLTAYLTYHFSKGHHGQPAAPHPALP